MRPLNPSPRAGTPSKPAPRLADERKAAFVPNRGTRLLEGLAEAIERCVAFEALGADVVYAEALESRREYEELRAALGPSTRTMLAQLQPDATSRPSLSLDEISALGFDLSLLGVTALQAVVAALRAAAEDVLEDGASPSACSFDDVKRVVGFGDLAAFEGEYACE